MSSNTFDASSFDIEQLADMVSNLVVAKLKKYSEETSEPTTAGSKTTSSKTTSSKTTSSKTGGSRANSPDIDDSDPDALIRAYETTPKSLTTKHLKAIVKHLYGVNDIKRGHDNYTAISKMAINPKEGSSTVKFSVVIDRLLDDQYNKVTDSESEDSVNELSSDDLADSDVEEVNQGGSKPSTEIIDSSDEE